MGFFIGCINTANWRAELCLGDVLGVPWFHQGSASTCHELWVCICKILEQVLLLFGFFSIGDILFSSEEGGTINRTYRNWAVFFFCSQNCGCRKGKTEMSVTGNSSRKVCPDCTQSPREWPWSFPGPDYMAQGAGRTLQCCCRHGFSSLHPSSVVPCKDSTVHFLWVWCVDLQNSS